MACEPLATEYQSTVPLDDNSSQEEIDKWMSTREVGCLINGEYHDAAYCKEFNNNRVTDSGEPLPHLNYVREAGFQAFVNDRGFGCVNKITGFTIRLDENGIPITPRNPVPEGGTFINEANDTVVELKGQGQPETACSEVCRKATNRSKVCIECVSAYLDDHGEECSELGEMKELERRSNMQEAMNCLQCMGDNIEDKYACVDPSRTTQTVESGQLFIIIVMSTLALVIIIAVIWTVVANKNKKKTRIVQNQAPTQVPLPVQTEEVIV